MKDIYTYYVALKKKFITYVEKTKIYLLFLDFMHIVKRYMELMIT